MHKLKICLLFGGVSPEHDVSLQTATSILKNIDREQFDVLPVGITSSGKWFLYEGPVNDIEDNSWENYPYLKPAFISPVANEGLLVFEAECIKKERIDCVFPALHGKDGEDGSIQGLCQLANLPCVGSLLTASAVSMDKSMTKAVVNGLGIRQADFILVLESEFSRHPEKIVKRVVDHFDFPVFVKPAGTGSSVGISKVKSEGELESAIMLAFEYDSRVLIEEFFNGREIEVAVLGNDDPLVSVCGEIVPGDEFYTYDDKYINGVSVAHIPADIPQETSDNIREAARRIYEANGCAGLSRVDFFVHKHTGEICFNEINTLPGFTDISMYPKLFIYGGISYPEIITRLIHLAVKA